ncbi:uncharacterized protein [Asterias amurensis]|uniref:uncharacterized protein n=1 Tax=Asterias amurensis TaxID=7602 RepID=UPI003AB1E7DC
MALCKSDDSTDDDNDNGLSSSDEEDGTSSVNFVHSSTQTRHHSGSEQESFSRRISEPRPMAYGVVFKSSLNIKPSIPALSFDSFEHTDVCTTTADHLRIVVIYRPPSSSITQFFDEFEDFITGLALYSGRLVVTGDFNIHVENVNSSNVQRLQELLTVTNFIQIVNGPTHIKNHTLDLVVVRDDDFQNWINLDVTQSSMSDHFSVLFALSIDKIDHTPSFESIDKQCFALDLTANLSTTSSESCPNAPTAFFITTIRLLFTPSINMTTDYSQEHSKEAPSLAKCSYYHDILSTSNQKIIFRTVNKLLGGSEIALPSTTPDATSLCNRFSNYFADKVATIRNDLEDQALHLPQEKTTPIPYRNCSSQLADLRPSNPIELLKIIKDSPSKSCSLDTIPTDILKQSVEAHLPILLSLVNTSSITGTFPTNLKKAVITPILKKPNLDKEHLSNYRPVSNLPFIGKLLERLANKRLIEHFNINNLNEDLQSAYKKHHSTDRTLLKVHHDISTALSVNKACLLVLLDLSAAFDTIDQDRLMCVLERQFGVVGKAKAWFASYLSHRSQRINIGSFTSDEFPLRFGVPQGSVLGPILFNVYTAPLEAVITSYKIHYHKYADDIQLYIFYNPNLDGDLERAISITSLRARVQFVTV